MEGVSEKASAGIWRDRVSVPCLLCSLGQAVCGGGRNHHETDGNGCVRPDGVSAGKQRYFVCNNGYIVRLCGGDCSESLYAGGDVSHIPGLSGRMSVVCIKGK